MATLRDQFAADAVALLSAAAVDSELVTYYEGEQAGRQIRALVLRSEPAIRSETTRVRAHRASLFILNHATAGVSSPSERGDMVDVVLRENAIAVRCRVTNVWAGDAGLWELEVMA